MGGDGVLHKGIECGSENEVGALGFEPRSAGVFCAGDLLTRKAGTGRRSSRSSQPSANPLLVIPVQLEPTMLPDYTIPPCM